MRPRRPLPLAEVELDLRCEGLAAFDGRPDEALSTVQAVGDWNEVRALLPNGEERRVAGGVTLPGLLAVRDHLDRGRRGAPVVGMEAVPVVSDGNEVTLGFRPPLVGSRSAALSAIDGLLDTLFETLRANGLDTRAVVERVAADRDSSLGDPVAVHDRITGRSSP